MGLVRFHGQHPGDLLDEEEGIVRRLDVEAAQVVFHGALEETANVLGPPHRRTGDAHPLVELTDGILDLHPAYQEGLPAQQGEEFA